MRPQTLSTIYPLKEIAFDFIIQLNQFFITNYFLPNNWSPDNYRVLCSVFRWYVIMWLPIMIFVNSALWLRALHHPWVISSHLAAGVRTRYPWHKGRSVCHKCYHLTCYLSKNAHFQWLGGGRTDKLPVWPCRAATCTQPIIFELALPQCVLDLLLCSNQPFYSNITRTNN